MISTSTGHRVPNLNASKQSSFRYGNDSDSQLHNYQNAADFGGNAQQNRDHIRETFGSSHGMTTSEQTAGN